MADTEVLEAWKDVCAAIDEVGAASLEAAALGKARTAAARMTRHGRALQDLVRTAFEEAATKRIEHQTAPVLLARLRDVCAAAEGDSSIMTLIVSAVGDAHDDVGRLVDLGDALLGRGGAHRPTRALLRRTLANGLVSHDSSTLQQAMARVFAASFASFHERHRPADALGDGASDSDMADGGAGVGAGGQAGGDEDAAFAEMSRRLAELGLLRTPQVQGALATSLWEAVDAHLRHSSVGRFDKPVLERGQLWLEHAVTPWLRLLFDVPGDDAGIRRRADGKATRARDSSWHPPSTTVDPLGYDDGTGGFGDYTDAFAESDGQWQRRRRSSSAGEADDGDGAADLLEQWEQRLAYHLHETFCDIRVEQLFDVVCSFPDSMPALLDLRTCLARTHRHRALVASFSAALRRRLLHPGAHTAHILEVLIATIRAMRVLDSRGVLLEAVKEPVIQYLRGRTDAVRCIVSSLTEDTGSELFTELQRGGGRIREHAELADDGEFDHASAVAAAAKGDPTEATAPGAAGGSQEHLWVPDPVESDPTKTARSRQSDLISMLVNIYGSKEMFVTEYRNMLADRLLSKADFDVEQEAHTLELLKLRFGDAPLADCAIMVRDLSESKKVNDAMREHLAVVRGAGGPGAAALDEADVAASRVPREALEATLVSRHFWPPLGRDTCVPHPHAAARLEEFSSVYSEVKEPRKLEFAHTLGTVVLELEFEGESREFSVSPLLATVIMHFEDKETWTLKELSDAVGVAPASLRRKVAYWVAQGVLVERATPDDAASGGVTYTAATRLGEGATSTAAAMGPEVEEEGGGGAAAAAAEEEMLMYESYVTGMLTNFDALPLDRIHNMLKMFADSYDKSQPELGRFLAELVRRDKLECDDGMYRLKT